LIGDQLDRSRIKKKEERRKMLIETKKNLLRPILETKVNATAVQK
jgi:hypothetical protein